MPLHDVLKTQKIACVRIYVERAIGRVKNIFQIFRRNIPLTLVGSVSQIWFICCMLTHFMGLSLLMRMKMTIMTADCVYVYGCFFLFH